MSLGYGIAFIEHQPFDQDGVVYEKDLGHKTVKIAESISICGRERPGERQKPGLFCEPGPDACC